LLYIETDGSMNVDRHTLVTRQNWLRHSDLATAFVNPLYSPIMAAE